MNKTQSLFKLHAPFKATGDQPSAIGKLIKNRPGSSTLLGATGSGKTFTIANVIAQQSKPVVILSPNKTLAAQLYEEFSLFFPENKVCYFVSYYDYYQPESYLPAQDMYIAKETKINDELDRLRIESTASAITRPDTIIISSVSCIYSLGNPEDYRNLAVPFHLGQNISKQNIIKKLLTIQYQRNDSAQESGTFQVFPDTIIVNLPYQRENLSIEFFDNTIERLSWKTKHNNEEVSILDSTVIFPAKHFVTTEEKRTKATKQILHELDIRIEQLENPIYKERLYNRVNRDVELIKQTGTCPGIENYSAVLEGRKPGERPSTLLDFFDDFLFIIDESHISLPQIRGMYAGDQARKSALVDFGFRLPSAKDNRPLTFDETETFFKDVIFVSATPGEYELSKSEHVAEQLIRPTGVIDPEITIISREKQLDKLQKEIEKTSKQGNRTLVTVLTKKLAEDLAKYLEKQGIKVCYLHHDLKTPQRTEVIHKLRSGVFECLIGINLLREGLDMPEVGMVAIMDADVESFLRDKRSLIQTIGRAARNAQGRVVMFADSITKSMRAAIDETERRRKVQMDYNKQHNIKPETTTRRVSKAISKKLTHSVTSKKNSHTNNLKTKQKKYTIKYIEEMKQQMHIAAENLDFETAIKLRDELKKILKK